MNKSTLEKLDNILGKYKSLERKMSHPDIVSDHKKIAQISKAHREVEPIAMKYSDYKSKVAKLNDIKKDSYEDRELQEMLDQEIEDLTSSIEEDKKEIELMLIPKDPNDNKDVIIEIRSGAGGDEASIFAADVFRMYERYIETIGWKLEVINSSSVLNGGLKEIAFSVKGLGAYSKLKFESGVHRVQRVPKTEASGRIHTSTITVAVLPKADDIEVNIHPSDIQVDLYRSSGAGGQHVNTTDSAVRLTHKPTGIVVTCQDGRSQLKNKEKAMSYLKARVYELEQRRAREEREGARRSQIGSGDRSEKIRTYNYPQGRVTDHRIGLTLHRLPEIINGDMDELINSLVSAEQAEKMAQ